MLMKKKGGGGTPPAQLRGLGERCKLPQRGHYAYAINIASGLGTRLR